MFDQNVTHVHRVNTLVDGVQTPSMVVVLTFSKPIPYSVTMGFRSFVVRAYFPKPMQCINGHRINHTMARWEFPVRCPKCAGSHSPPSNRESKAKCINCQRTPTSRVNFFPNLYLKFEWPKIRQGKQRLSSLCPSPSSVLFADSAPPEPSVFELAQQKKMIVWIL